MRLQVFAKFNFSYIFWTKVKENIGQIMKSFENTFIAQRKCWQVTAPTIWPTFLLQTKDIAL